jgi:hypothetical protein
MRGPDAGCSGTPLLRKLGQRDGQTALFVGLPEILAGALLATAFGHCWRLEPTGPLPEALPPLDTAHVLATERAVMASWLGRLRPQLAPAGMLWASWPKRAARVPTDLGEDAIRGLALPMGLIDVKVCAVDAVWSGLKPLIRRELRRRAGLDPRPPPSDGPPPRRLRPSRC